MRMARDAGADSTVVRDLIADDGASSSIHDKPDIGLDAPYLDVGSSAVKTDPFA